METIFAPICPLGGSIVSVRFSGDNAFDVLDFFHISSDVYKKKDLFFATLRYKDNNIGESNSLKILDEVIIKIFRGTNSFTGENVIEIDLHSNKLILEEFLQLVSGIQNFRFAKNGEFSRRAFLNGKMNLIKSEGINAIIRSETKQQQLLANDMFYGKVNKEYQNIRNKLIEAMSYVETQIDFAEEEVPKNVIDNIKLITKDLIEKISTCLEDKKAIDKINQGILISIIGKPNVGKSSLLNWLAKREVAIVSPIEGTTRDLISVDIDIDGYKTTFYDTAGTRETDDLIEKEGVRRAKNISENSDLCIFICDNFNDIVDAIEERKKFQNDCLFILNKIDIQNNNEFNKKKYKISKEYQDSVVEISVLNNTNLNILMEKIKDIVIKQVELKSQPIVLNERHSILLNRCISHLKNIDFETLQIELIGEELRSAIEDIGQITGQIYTDDILDNIFNKFCIGK